MNGLAAAPGGRPMKHGRGLGGRRSLAVCQSLAERFPNNIVCLDPVVTIGG